MQQPVKRPGIVHRLDKDTSGLLIVAKNDKAHIHMSEQIKNRKVKKVYIALVRGIINENEATNENGITEKNKKESEENKMTKTMKIEGMMCGHCEARVKKALEALDQVEQAEVSHEKGSAVVTLKETVTDEVLKKAVEDQDYKVTDIQ